MNIVAKFQERLDIGRGEAIARVIVFIFLSICFVATAVAPFLIFPYKTNIKEKIAMLPGNHTQVSSLGVHDFYANEDKFTKIMGLRSVQTSVFLAGDTIFYTVMIDGLSYRHGQTVLVDPRYVIHSQRIEGGFVIREMKRNPVFIGTFCILFPLLLSFVLPLFIILIQENRKCGERRTNYKYVFCAWLDKLI